MAKTEDFTPVFCKYCYYLNNRDKMEWMCLGSQKMFQTFQNSQEHLSNFIYTQNTFPKKVFIFLLLYQTEQ